MAHAQITSGHLIWAHVQLGALRHWVKVSVSKSLQSRYQLPSKHSSSLPLSTKYVSKYKRIPIDVYNTHRLRGWRARLIPSEAAKSLPVLIEFVWLLCELLKCRSRLPPRVTPHRQLQACQTRCTTFTKRDSSYMATASLNLIRLLNSFSRRLKLSPVLGSSLPSPLLSPAITQVVDYPLTDSYLHLYHQCLSIETFIESRPVIFL